MSICNHDYNHIAPDRRAYIQQSSFEGDLVWSCCDQEEDAPPCKATMHRVPKNTPMELKRKQKEGRLMAMFDEDDRMREDGGVAVGGLEGTVEREGDIAVRGEWVSVNEFGERMSVKRGKDRGWRGEADSLAEQLPSAEDQQQGGGGLEGGGLGGDFEGALRLKGSMGSRRGSFFVDEFGGERMFGMGVKYDEDQGVFGKRQQPVAEKQPIVEVKERPSNRQRGKLCRFARQDDSG